MSGSRPEQLVRAEELMNNGNVEKALEIVLNFEKTYELTPKDRLSALLLKGSIFGIVLELIYTNELVSKIFNLSINYNYILEILIFFRTYEKKSRR